MHVGVLQGGRHLADDGESLLDRKLPLPCQPLAQVFPPHIRHDVEEEARGLARVVQRQDVGVGKPGGHPDLPDEPLRAEDRAQLRPQDLEGHLAVVLEVVGQIDGRHAAPPQLALEGIAADESGVQTGELIGVGHVPRYGGWRGSQRALDREDNALRISRLCLVIGR